MDKENCRTPTPKEAYCESRMYGPVEDGKPTIPKLRKELMEENEYLQKKVAELETENERLKAPPKKEKPTHVILAEMLKKKHDGLLEEIEEIKSQQLMFLGEIELLWESVRVLEGDLESATDVVEAKNGQ